MSGLYLGFDVGTQGAKAVALDPEGGVLARVAVPYGLLPGLAPGAAEQHPDTWAEAVRDCAAALFAEPAVDPGAVRGVGVSGQQHGLVVLDKAGRVVRPAKLWCDTTTATEAAELSSALGRPVPAGFTAPKVRWLARHEPEHWAATRTVLLPHDYVNFCLTGNLRAEAGDASGTGWFNPVKRDWDMDAAAVVDARLPGLLAPLGAPGHLSRAGSELLGLEPGVPVASGGGDNMMSAIGSGATRPGVVTLSLGTSGTAFAYSEIPVIDPEGWVAPFCDSTGAWLPLVCVMNMTGVTEEILAAFPGESLDSLTAAAADVRPGAGGLIFVPYLQGERVPDLPRATGALTGIRPGLLRPGHIFRAGVEGTSLSLGIGVERMCRLGVPMESVRLVGGGARNPLWRRVLADVLAVPVQALAEPESAALGAAVQALAGAEDVTPDAAAARFVAFDGDPCDADPDAVAVYGEARELFRDHVARLFG